MNTLSLLPPLLTGWLAGWLVNYASDVLPKHRRFVEPACVGCGTAFSWSDYLLLRPCPACGRKRGARAWLAQFALIAAAFWLWLDPQKGGFALNLALIAFLAAVFVMDWEHRLIMHPVSLFGALLGLLYGGVTRGLTAALVGGAAGFGIMFALYLMGMVFTALRARRLRRAGRRLDEEEALGFGDVTLGGVLGLILGWPGILGGLFGGILLGGLASLLIMLYLWFSGLYRKYGLTVFIPLGPFYILATFALLYIL